LVFSSGFGGLESEGRPSRCRRRRRRIPLPEERQDDAQWKRLPAQLLYRWTIIGIGTAAVVVPPSDIIIICSGTKKCIITVARLQRRKRERFILRSIACVLFVRSVIFPPPPSSSFRDSGLRKSKQPPSPVNSLIASAVTRVLNYLNARQT